MSLNDPLRSAFCALLALGAATVSWATPAVKPVSPTQIAFGGPTGDQEKARVEIYDSLKRLPRETPVSRVAEAVGPSVVYVETEMVQPVRTIIGYKTQHRRGSGSGVVIHPSGLIITNYHVVEGAQDIKVSFQGVAESYAAELISFVRAEDLALLKIQVPAEVEPLKSQAGLRQRRSTRGSSGEPTGTAIGTDSSPQSGPGAQAFPTVRMGTSADLMAGERVVAIGSPHGQTYTVSTGIISGLHRNVPVPGRNLNFEGLIQTDASINFGNSGGPLLNIHGELIGINTVMNTSAENIGFAIPVDRVSQVLADVLFPNARRTWLGFEVAEDAAGIVVTKVWPTGPAEGSGLCEGDRLVSLGGIPVEDWEAYLFRSLEVAVGRPVEVGFSRGSEQFRATLEGWDELNGFFYRDIGMTVQEIQLGRHRQSLLQVSAVLPGSPADELGVHVGDLLQAARPLLRRGSRAIHLSDKATLKAILDRVPKGTEIEIDAYRDQDGDLTYHRNELLKGVLVR